MRAHQHITLAFITHEVTTRDITRLQDGFHLPSQSILSAHSKVLSSLRPLTASLARMGADIKKVVAFTADKLVLFLIFVIQYG